MKKIIECVPNFSEGKDQNKIELIVQEIKKVNGIKLLDVKPDPDHNRTVVTFVGEPEHLKEAAFNAISKASDLIDMSLHKGQHPRMGAADVCPFVPIRNATMEECATLANEVGKEVGEKLKIPVYLYGEAARIAERRDLNHIRKGEYEGLEEKLKDPQWKPDYGPAIFNKKSGATVIGARVFMVGLNVNLMTPDITVAKDIAKKIREEGWTETLPDGAKIKVAGLLKSVKAMGILLREQGLTQIGMNLNNYKATPMHAAYETIKRLAGERGVEILGSEIIGVVLKDAVLDSGRFYLPEGTDEEKLIDAAVKNLGLNLVEKFIPEKKIIEYMIND